MNAPTYTKDYPQDSREIYGDITEENPAPEGWTLECERAYEHHRIMAVICEHGEYLTRAEWFGREFQPSDDILSFAN